MMLSVLLAVPFLFLAAALFAAGSAIAFEDDAIAWARPLGLVVMLAAVGVFVVLALAVSQ